MEVGEEFELISLSSIRIKLRLDIYSDASPAEFECTVLIDTGVFSGQFETVYFDEDLIAFKNKLEKLRIPGTVVLGGNRCAEIIFDMSKQIGGNQGALAITVSASPFGDDPFPKLTFLEFEVSPEFPKTTIRRIDQFLALNAAK